MMRRGCVAEGPYPMSTLGTTEPRLQRLDARARLQYTSSRPSRFIRRRSASRSSDVGKKRWTRVRAIGVEGSDVGDESEIELTQAERAMIQEEYLKDEDAMESPPADPNFVDDIAEPFVLKDGDEEIFIGTEFENQGYQDRKPFVDHEALEQTKSFGRAMANVADEMKCQSIRLVDVHTQVYWTDLFLILTAMSRTQLSAVLGKMEKVALEEWNTPVQESVTRRSEWECIDFGNLIVHAFSPRTRDHYKLDAVYSQCKEVTPSPSNPRS